MQMYFRAPSAWQLGIDRCSRKGTQANKNDATFCNIFNYILNTVFKSCLEQRLPSNENASCRNKKALKVWEMWSTSAGTVKVYVSFQISLHSSLFPQSSLSSPFVYPPTLVIFFPHLSPRTLLLWTLRHIFINFFLCCGEYFGGKVYGSQ